MLAYLLRQAQTKGKLMGRRWLPFFVSPVEKPFGNAYEFLRATILAQLVAARDSQPRQMLDVGGLPPVEPPVQRADVWAPEIIKVYG